MLRIPLRKLFQCGVEFQQMLMGIGDLSGIEDLIRIDIESVHVTAMNLAVLLASPFGQDSPHHFCGGTQKMATSIPILVDAFTDQPEINFVYQVGCLQRLPGRLLRDSLPGEDPQFIVDQR